MYRLISLIIVFLFFSSNSSPVFAFSCMFGYIDFTECYIEELADCSGVEDMCRYKVAKYCDKKFPKASCV